jgi:hypothetical protein
LNNIDDIQKKIFKFDFSNLIDDSHHFDDDHPDFSKGMIEATGIDDLPTEHTGINGFAHNIDEKPIIGGAIFNLDLPDRKPLSFDNNGYYHDDTFKWGLYRFKFTHPEYQDIIDTINIPRGRKVVHNIIMIKR